MPVTSDVAKCPETNRNNPSTTPIVVIAPNARTRALSSMNTGPASSAANAGSSRLPATPKAMLLASAHSATIMKYSAENTPMLM